jgi:hypothetical protein
MSPWPTLALKAAVSHGTAPLVASFQRADVVRWRTFVDRALTVKTSGAPGFRTFFFGDAGNASDCGGAGNSAFKHDASSWSLLAFRQITIESASGTNSLHSRITSPVQRASASALCATAGIALPNKNDAAISATAMILDGKSTLILQCSSEKSAATVCVAALGSTAIPSRVFRSGHQAH